MVWRSRFSSKSKSLSLCGLWCWLVGRRLPWAKQLGLLFVRIGVLRPFMLSHFTVNANGLTDSTEIICASVAHSATRSSNTLLCQLKMPANPMWPANRVWWWVGCQASRQVHQTALIDREKIERVAGQQPSVAKKNAHPIFCVRPLFALGHDKTQLFGRCLRNISTLQVFLGEKN